jgi:hypothetical protein
LFPTKTPSIPAPSSLKTHSKWRLEVQAELYAAPSLNWLSPPSSDELLLPLPTLPALELHLHHVPLSLLHFNRRVVSRPLTLLAQRSKFTVLEFKQYYSSSVTDPPVQSVKTGREKSSS